MTKRGFTLVELLVAVAVMAVLATALTRMLLTDSRFVSEQDAIMSARQSARAAHNVLGVELRMVSDGGLLAAASDSISVRVPYAFGMACNVSSTFRFASLMPADSLMYATATPTGIAERQANGSYTFREGISVAFESDSTPCTSAGIHVIPGGQVVSITPATAAPAGFVFYLYQTTSYKLAPSTDLPGRRGLWRKIGNGSYEEIVAPFDSSARFRFIVGSNPTPSDVPPADLSTVNGLELKIVTQSYVRPQGKSEYETFELPVHVIFQNGVG